MNRWALPILVTFLGCGLIVVYLTPPARRIAFRFGLVDHPGGRDYKWHTEPTAFVGGLVVAGALIVAVVPLLLTMPSGTKIVAILIGAGLCAAVGLWDDRRPLAWTPKLIPPVAGAVLLWMAGIRTGVFGEPVADFLLLVLWVVVVTHALNVIDNMDGVAVGLAGVSALGVVAIALATGQPRVAIAAAAVAGACLGFLPFNFRPATVFLGDSGALFLGFILASLPLLLDLPGRSKPARPAVPVLLVGVPLFNTMLVVVSRWRRRVRITVGGTDGLAHRLVLVGIDRNAAAMVFWAAAALLATAAWFIAAAPPVAAVLTSAGYLIASVIGVAWFESIAPIAVAVRSPRENLSAGETPPLPLA
jgi:UDP-GlcNAc:undecaprenyl-phosphate/decaprenyl-phosphate GlcNAc-1-phosphate transferase